MNTLFCAFKSLFLRCLIASLILPAAAFASADLAVTSATYDPATPMVGGDINYYFTVHNNGPDAASNITLYINALGDQVYQGSASPYPFTYDSQNQYYTATIGSLGADSDAPFRISFHITQASVLHVYLVVASSDDPDSSNDTAEQEVNVLGGATADLTVASVTVTPNPANVGDLRHYHGTVTNNGPDAATNVAIAIQADSQDQNGFGFDAYETFDHSVPSPNPPGADANGIRYIPLGNIAANASVSFDAFYNAIQQGSFIRNFFLSLSGAQTDPNLNNNHFVTSSTIGQGITNSADLSVSVTAPTSTTVGSNITYHFHIVNSGLSPSTAHGVQVTVAPSPTNEQIVSATVPYTVNVHGAIVQVPDLAPGGPYDFSFVFKATEPGEIDLTGSVSSTTTDPNPSNNNVTRVTNANPAPPPPHGGLSPTSFTVNGSYTPASNVADTVLRFAATQLATPAGLKVRVQYTTSTAQTPPESSWTDLNNGDSGRMTYDPSQTQFFLSSLNYPTVNHVSFRAISSASGVLPDSISNKVGPFNLASNKPRLVSPILAVTGNGPFADLYFRTLSSSTVSGTTERVQQSTTPFDENSWGNLTDGRGGAMLQTNDPKRFYLMANRIQSGHGIFFRVIASHSGYADGISKPNGPYNITRDTPPTITNFTISQKPQGGNGTAQSPVVFAPGQLTFNIATSASSGRQLKQIKLLYDGSTRYEVSGSGTTLHYTTSLLTPGDHIFEAVAVDDLGATGRASTRPIFVRIKPGSGAALHAEHAIGDQSATNAAAGGRTFTVVRSGGNWTDASTWKDGVGTSGVPGNNDFAIIGSATVKIPNFNDIDVAAISINGGHLVGPGGLIIHSMFTVNGGYFDNRLSLEIVTGAVVEMLGADNLVFTGGTVANKGTWNMHGSGGIISLESFTNQGTTAFQGLLQIPSGAGVNPTLDTRLIAANTVSTTGLIKSALTSRLIGQDGNGIISQDGNSVISNDGGTLIGQDGNGVISNDGGTLIGQDGNGIVAQGGGNIVTANGTSLHGEEEAQETLRAKDAEVETANGGFVQTGGETDLNGISITGSVTLNGGVLSGSGIIYGSLTNSSGFIMPGHSAGAIGITGNFVQGANGSLVVDDGGKTPDKFDQLQVGGTATLGGTLDLRTINGYRPNVADMFSPASFSSASGNFAVSANGTVTRKGSGILTTVNPAIASPKASQALNISTRAKVQTGDNVTIAGFIITGPTGSTKKVIVRGLGPSLSSAGIKGVLADPYIELHKGATLLATNDNWRQRQSEVQASGIPPTNDKESAIVATLAPGAYTVTLRGAHNEIGVGLIEVYDLAQSSAASLANISTRCQVLTGDQVMIGGFIIKGGLPSKIIVRAIGPSLAKQGVKGALADPLLELHDSNGMEITNDDWRANQESEIIATTIPPSDSREAAIVATLPSGPYTAIVRGANNTTGVALVEAYNLQ